MYPSAVRPSNSSPRYEDTEAASEETFGLETPSDTLRE